MDILLFHYYLRTVDTLKLPFSPHRCAHFGYCKKRTLSQFDPSFPKYSYWREIMAFIWLFVCLILNCTAVWTANAGKICYIQLTSQSNNQAQNLEFLFCTKNTSANSGALEYVKLWFSVPRWERVVGLHGNTAVSLVLFLQATSPALTFSRDFLNFLLVCLEWGSCLLFLWWYKS